MPDRPDDARVQDQRTAPLELHAPQGYHLTPPYRISGKQLLPAFRAQTVLEAGRSSRSKLKERWREPLVKAGGLLETFFAPDGGFLPIDTLEQPPFARLCEIRGFFYAGPMSCLKAMARYLQGHRRRPRLELMFGPARPLGLRHGLARWKEQTALEQVRLCLALP